MKTNRRGFLKVAGLAGAGLVTGCNSAKAASGSLDKKQFLHLIISGKKQKNSINNYLICQVTVLLNWMSSGLVFWE